MIEIKSVKIDVIENNILRDRAIRARCGRSTEYIAIINEIEVAFLSCEDWSNVSEVFIYEIFVLPEYRGKGIGNHLIKFSENKAKELNCNKVLLRPEPFDKTIGFDFLLSWYKRLGYEKMKSRPDIMFKNIF